MATILASVVRAIEVYQSYSGSLDEGEVSALSTLLALKATVAEKLRVTRHPFPTASPFPNSPRAK